MAADDETNPKSSQTIGHLVQRIVTSLKPEDGVMGVSVTKPNASEPIISAKVSPGSIGQRAGDCGAVVPTQSFEIDPVTVLKNPLQAMPHSVSGSLKRTIRDRIHPQYGWDGDEAGWHLAYPIDPEARQEAMRVLAAALEPGPPREIVGQLRRLRAMVIGGEFDDPAMQMAVYAKALMGVPAAAVELACEDWAKKSEVGRLWPPFADLWQLIEQRLALSRQLLEALK